MREYLNKVFYLITEKLELTDSQIGTIEKAYNAVADWLSRETSALEKYDICIYPQGSMKLGTVVRPLNTDDYDVDMVCVFKKNTDYLTPFDVKNMVGNRIKENATYQKMLKPEGKRCWTLQYSDELNFHMDILPAVPSKTRGIKATHKDRTHYYFFDTAPHEYAEWFKKRMVSSTKFYMRDEIERLPDFPTKTPLQKTIQLLKRHRDVMFIDDQDNAPASIIITTIAANLYEQETNLLRVFEKILNNIESQIENRNGVWWVENPVNSNENFADKWRTDSKKKEVFFIWIKKVRQDYRKLLESKTKQELLSNLYAMFGQSIVDQANDELGGFDAVVPTQLIEAKEIIPYSYQVALSVKHRQKPEWKLPSWNMAKIEAIASDGYAQRPIKSGEPLKKGITLKFSAIHGIKRPYLVKWQVTNTGAEALSNHCLRGDFYNSDTCGENIRTETTSYTGIHYVQCFIIKRKQCVAKSKEFIVNII